MKNIQWHMLNYQKWNVYVHVIYLQLWNNWFFKINQLDKIHPKLLLKAIFFFALNISQKYTKSSKIFSCQPWMTSKFCQIILHTAHPSPIPLLTRIVKSIYTLKYKNGFSLMFLCTNRKRNRQLDIILQIWAIYMYILYSTTVSVILPPLSPTFLAQLNWKLR